MRLATVFGAGLRRGPPQPTSTGSRLLGHFLDSRRRHEKMGLILIEKQP
jgi:hypothetical protein